MALRRSAPSPSSPPANVSSAGRRRWRRWAEWGGSGRCSVRRCGCSCSSFAGLPLTGGFVAKFYAFAAAWDRGWTWLVVVGVIATAFSLYYYLAVIRALYMRPALPLAAPAGGQPPRELVLSAAVVGLHGRRRRLVLRRRAAHRPRPRRRRLAHVPATNAEEPPLKVSSLECRSSYIRLERNGWDAHLAGTFRLPDRHAGRQARLRRSVPQRQPEVPRGRARAGARRPHPAHARPRRPRGRHDRPVREVHAAR